MHNKKKKNNKLKIIGQKIHLIIDLASRVKVKTILIILTIHLIFKILFKRKSLKNNYSQILKKTKINKINKF